MKKSTGLVLALCMLLTAAGCNSSIDKTDKNTSEASSLTASASTSESTSTYNEAVKAEQTAESTDSADTTSEAPADIAYSEKEVRILELCERKTSQYRWSDETAMPLIECECSSVILSGKDADLFPSLAAALTEAADAEERSFKNEYEMFSRTIDEMIDAGMELHSPLISKFDAQVRRADNIVLSVLTDCHYDNGMNGGHRSLWGSNYDAQTGKTLYLPDIVTDIDAFAQAVEKKLFGTVGADVFYNDGIIKEYFEMYGSDGTHWTIDYNGVTVYFDSGEIADMGVGGMNVTITFSEHHGLFNEKYTAVPEAYLVSMPVKYTFYTDLDGDGRCEELAVYDRYDEKKDYSVTADICTVADTYSESFTAYSLEPYYVKTADSKHYLYLFTELETQMYLYVYDITGGTVSKVGESNVSPYYNDGISAILTDPENMHFNIFSDDADNVYEGNDLFTVGANGMPTQK